MIKKSLLLVVLISTFMVILSLSLSSPFLAVLAGVLILLGVLFLRNPYISIDKLILATIFFAPYSNTFVLDAGFANFRILQLFWIIILGALLIKRALSSDLSIPNINGSGIVFLLYIGILLVSTAFSQRFAISLKELIQYTYFIIITYVTVVKTKDPRFYDQAISTMVKSNVMFVTLSLISYIIGISLIPNVTVCVSGYYHINFNIYDMQNLVESAVQINRISGMSGLGPIGIANVILIQSFLVNYKIRQTSGKQKIAYLLILFMNFIIIVLTYSRIALIIFILLHIYTLISKDHRRNFLLFSLTMAGVVAFLLTFPNVMMRLLETLNFEEASTKYHFVFWMVGIELGLKHPFSGVGLGGAKYSLLDFTQYFRDFKIFSASGVDTHNFILQIWAEQGILGLVVNLVLIFAPLFFLIKWNIKNRDYSRSTIYFYLSLSYIATLGFNLTNNNFYIEIFWMLLALIYASKNQIQTQPNLVGLVDKTLLLREMDNHENRLYNKQPGTL